MNENVICIIFQFLFSFAVEHNWLGRRTAKVFRFGSFYSRLILYPQGLIFPHPRQNWQVYCSISTYTEAISRSSQTVPYCASEDVRYRTADCVCVSWGGYWRGSQLSVQSPFPFYIHFGIGLFKTTASVIISTHLLSAHSRLSVCEVYYTCCEDIHVFTWLATLLGTKLVMCRSWTKQLYEVKDGSRLLYIYIHISCSDILYQYWIWTHTFVSTAVQEQFIHYTENANSRGKTESGRRIAVILSQSYEGSLCGGREISGRERQRGREEGGRKGKQDGWVKR